ncbi:ATP-grasp domain-containing protein [Limnobacter humi]|uniref:ATP-grasp domain-containing protein n=1 Tax=Limnobacter humi TaxID=1778671 RepID=A0ABT1WLB3_9BURK|nr:biotin carboxylase N-terminal domain-containing protein [Limnobacter humi]MCQ8897624.1 ATP-grasp domain-containing protein [Limnobacter humi]
MFQKILIANRGEIARRINRTAQAMGIATVAVYSEADAQALHVRECDEAVCIGPAPASESYLNIGKIMAAAKATGAQAIHPGYGFLSENAAFAQACADAGVVFIGPGVQAIRTMGSKSEAKACVQPAGVPLIPGYFGADQSLPTLQAEAARIGYPLMIKAVAGGGGKGIRVVNSSDELPAALESCQREAKNAFGDATVMLEKQIIRPRHVEVQVFADSHGHVVHLYERDCSAQRRHQKVIEEAPAHGLSQALREAIGQTAVQVARAVNYLGAGTVEFLLDARGDYYFMEMNTRLQVEHPVTEMIAGFDLVEWQIRIAAGEPLPVQQADISTFGHAFEARLYAENPEQGFLPAIGEVVLWETPPAAEFNRSQAVRLDGAIASGLSVTPHYDPMIGKLIVWGEDRAQALSLLVKTLSQLRCVGLKNNLQWLKSLCLHPEFQAGGYDTGLIDRMGVESAADSSAQPMPIVLAALAAVARWGQQTDWQTADPLARLDGFSSAVPLMRQDHWQTRHDDRWVVKSHVAALKSGLLVRTQVAGSSVVALSVQVSSRARQGDLNRIQGEVQSDAGFKPFDLIWHRDQLHVHLGDCQHTLLWLNPTHIRADDAHSGHGVAAPMPGKVFAVHVKPGDAVKKGQALVGLEAMKMEHTLTAPKDAVVKAVVHQVGEQVAEGTELVEFEE